MEQSALSVPSPQPHSRFLRLAWKQMCWPGLCQLCLGGGISWARVCRTKASRVWTQHRWSHFCHLCAVSLPENQSNLINFLSIFAPYVCLQGPVMITILSKVTCVQVIGFALECAGDQAAGMLGCTSPLPACWLGYSLKVKWDNLPVVAITNGAPGSEACYSMCSEASCVLKASISYYKKPQTFTAFSQVVAALPLSVSPKAVI